MQFNFLVINGPNLNLLGIRQPNQYGSQTYDDLLFQIKNYSFANHWNIDFYQSNHEGDLVDKIQEAYFKKIDGIVINAGAYTHTSIAIFDALKAVSIPTVEVHLSKVDKREDFRKKSYLGKACLDTISGHGFLGYLEALDLLEKHLKEKT